MNNIKRVCEMIKIYFKRVIKILFISLVCFYAEIVLESLGLMGLFNANIKYMTVPLVQQVLGILIVIFIIIYASNKEINSLDIFIKKNNHYIVFVVFFFEIIILYKCSNIGQLLISILECGIIYYLINYVDTLMFNYSYNYTSLTGRNYVERPVVGRDNLTPKQEETLNLLEKLIEKRKATDSFNIALIGAYGCGKTSITDTLIYEYEQNRQPYFMLKIGTLTLKEGENIAIYVRNYFENLFKKYEIGISSAGVTFLTSLVKTFSNNTSLKGMFDNAKSTSFCDIEKEKALFTKQVATLLKISGKKNIILIIDDTDRSENEMEIIKLLEEYSSVEGIISIVALDKSKDIVIRPGLCNMDKETVYNQIDKYIHIRVRVNDDDHIDHEMNLTEQIIDSYNNISYKDACFISFNNSITGKSLFDGIISYETTEIVNHNSFSSGNMNILTKIFCENLKRKSKSFGDYFEEIINEHIYKTKELAPYIREMLTLSPEKWDIKLFQINFQWTDRKEIDSLLRLNNNSNTLFWTLCQILDGIYLISDDKDILDKIKNIDEIYIYYMKTKYSANITYDDNISNSHITYPGLDQVKIIVFGKKLYNELNSYIEAKDYEHVKKILLGKIRDVSKLLVITMMLVDFIDYLRTIMNNYRMFKMQLREAELLDTDYLDYLIKEWQPRKEIKKNLDIIKENYSFMAEIQIDMPQLRSIINHFLFEYYILKYSFHRSKDTNNYKMFLYNNGEEKIIVIKKILMDNNCIEYTFLDIEGLPIKLTVEEENRIKEKYNDSIYN